MRVGLRRRLQVAIGIVMLPLSLLPFVAYFRGTPEGRFLWTRATLRFFPPSLPAESRPRPAPPGYSGAVAVLVYHGVGSSTDAEGQFSVSVSRFAEQLAAMRSAGIHFVTARELARMWREKVPPPRNAVMITFDDGRAEAMMLADPLLREARAKATMFVIGDAASDPGIFYASEGALSRYAASGRWDLESHTDGQHDLQDTNLGMLPKLTSLAPGETLTDYRHRVSEDLDRVDDQLRQITGREPVAFAYPFGAYGGDRTNDVRIRGALHQVLDERYALAFHQDEQAKVPLVTCTDRALALRRLDVLAWSGRELLQRVDQMARRTDFDPRCPGTPRSPAVIEPQPLAPVPMDTVGMSGLAGVGSAHRGPSTTGGLSAATANPPAPAVGTTTVPPTPLTTTPSATRPPPTSPPTTRPPPQQPTTTTTRPRPSGPPWGKGGKHGALSAASAARGP